VIGLIFGIAMGRLNHNLSNSTGNEADRFKTSELIFLQLLWPAYLIVFISAHFTNNTNDNE